MTKAWTASSGGVSWGLELERDGLLPGRLVAGRVRVSARDGVVARGLLVTLRGEERWQYEVTTTDPQGHTTTERRTGRQALPPEPVLVLGPLTLAPGETREAAVQLPVAALGPPTVTAEMALVEWSVEARLDIADGFDSSIEVPVRVLQPVALLRAGVVRVGEFALYPSADGAGGDVAGTIALDPVPLGAGSPFRGRVTLRTGGAINVREIRAELRVKVDATVSGGLHETITAWRGVIACAGQVSGEQSYDLSGILDAAVPPTAEMPHGRVSATFHVILDRPMAPDSRLERDVAVASTLEL